MKRNTPRTATQPAISKTVARLVQQIHAEAEAATLAALSAKDGILVLHPVDSATKRVQFFAVGDSLGLEIEDAGGNGCTLYQRGKRPEGWRDWHPSHWCGHHSLTDSMGRKWVRCGDTYVVDDFGTLVLVGAA